MALVGAGIESETQSCIYCSLTECHTEPHGSYKYQLVGWCYLWNDQNTFAARNTIVEIK